MKFGLLFLAALGFGAVQAGAQDVPAALERCATMSDDHARLSCYDGVAAGFRHAAAAQPVTPHPVAALPSVTAAARPPAAAPVIAPPPVAAKVAEFGTDTMRKPEPERGAPKEIDEIKATITQVEFSQNNRFIVTLDNGQVWRQIEADSTKARFRKSGEAVTISRGVLGSYNLTLDEHAVLYKVRRLR